jgi:RNA-binding protein YhbY
MQGAGQLSFVKKECAEEISKQTEIEVVQVIGKTLVLFSQHPEDPRIKFPSA